nr:MAG TPA: hypothetical protein [Caudoviricetes sp.]
MDRTQNLHIFSTKPSRVLHEISIIFSKKKGNYRVPLVLECSRYASPRNFCHRVIFRIQNRGIRVQIPAIVRIFQALTCIRDSFSQVVETIRVVHPLHMVVPETYLKHFFLQSWARVFAAP